MLLFFKKKKKKEHHLSSFNSVSWQTSWAFFKYTAKWGSLSSSFRVPIPPECQAPGRFAPHHSQVFLLAKSKVYTQPHCSVLPSLKHFTDCKQNKTFLFCTGTLFPCYLGEQHKDIQIVPQGLSASDSAGRCRMAQTRAVIHLTSQYRGL